MRVEVSSERGPVSGALVKLREASLQTGADGIANRPQLPLGPLTIAVTKEGYFPSTTTVAIDQVPGVDDLDRAHPDGDG